MAKRVGNRRRRSTVGGMQAVAPGNVEPPGPGDEPTPAVLRSLLQNHACFKIHSRDGMHWIDPYTGKAVEAPFDYQEIGFKHLSATKPWRERRIMGKGAMRIVVWVHHLRDHIGEDKRYRIFSNSGNWLNPFTGEWVTDIPRQNGRIGKETLRGMARALAGCSDEQLGREKDWELLDRIRRKEQPLPGLQEKRETEFIDGRDLQSGAPALGGLHSRHSTTVHQPITEPSRGGALEHKPAPPKGPTIDHDDEDTINLLFDEEATAPAPPDATADVEAEPASGQRAIGTKRFQWKGPVHLDDEQRMHEVLRDHGMTLAQHEGRDDDEEGRMHMACLLDEQHLLMVMGDTPSGFGLSSPRTIGRLRDALLTELGQRHSLPDLATAMNQTLRRHADGHQRCSLLVSVLHVPTASLTLINHGHKPLLIGNPTNEILVRVLGRNCGVLGQSSTATVRRKAGPQTYECVSGDVILFHHGRWFDIQSPEGNPFGRMQAYGSFAASLEMPAPAIIEEIVADIESFGECHAPGFMLLRYR